MTARDFLFILITIFIWGTNFIAIAWGLEEMPPFFFVALRFFLVFFPFVFFISRPEVEWWKIAGLGLTVAILQFGFLFFAMKIGLRAGVASLLMQIQVAFTILLSFIVFGERVGRAQLIGIIIAFSGFGYFFWLRAGGGHEVLPIFIALLGAFAWAWGNLIYKVVGNANRFHLTIYSALIVPLPMFVISFFWESREPLAILTSMSLRAWLSLLYTSLFSTIIAYSLWGILLGKYKAARVTPFALLIPIVGMISAAILLGERLSLPEMIASAVVLIGLGLCVLAPDFQSKGKNAKGKA